MIDEEIAESITRIAAAGLKARVGAHSRCKFEDVKRALDCGVSFLGIFLSVSEERLKNDYKTNLDDAMRRITELIRYAKGRDPDLWIRYTAEDAVRSSFDNVLKAATAAAKAGANIISVADTTGYSTPFEESRTISRYVNSLREGLAHGLHPKSSIATTTEVWLSNALDALEAKRTSLMQRFKTCRTDRHR
jgi:2-isopropylmalate synthase